MQIKAILFDWGNTVMRAFPQYHGPMASWPTVEVMPGIAHALPLLADEYTLCLATNAADSSMDEVRSALARVQLDGHFQHIFTAGKLGSGKPQKKFFSHILDHLGVDASEVIMVGDDLHADIAGAFNAGIRSIWINDNPIISTRSHPLQMAELLSADSLPISVQDISRNTLPGLDESISLLNLHPFTPEL